jgi:DNA-binding XRE family transcriptional regulator
MLQIDLATCVGMSKQSLSAIEVGRQGMSLDQFVALADCLYVTPAELIPDPYRCVVGERKRT